MNKHMWAAIIAVTLLVAGCGKYEGPAGAAPVEGGGDAGVAGSIEIDGSSTVAPLTDAIAEEYAAEQPNVTVNVGVSGTGGGFERFCAGETDISDASRPIADDEADLCAKAGIKYVELHVGTDAMTMVTSPETDFVDCLTTEQVVKIFGEEDPATTWQEVDPQLPAEPLQVFAPDTDSGTYDFMVEDVLGAETSRQDYNASADDNITAQGVIGTPGSWGFFGFAFYQESADQLKVLQYDGGDGCVTPSVETAQDGSYKMTRPLYIYVRADALQRPHIGAFVTYYLDSVNALIEDVGYIAQPEAELDEVKDTLRDALNS